GPARVATPPRPRLGRWIAFPHAPLVAPGPVRDLSPGRGRDPEQLLVEAGDSVIRLGDGGPGRLFVPVPNGDGASRHVLRRPGGPSPARRRGDGGACHSAGGNDREAFESENLLGTWAAPREGTDGELRVGRRQLPEP